MQAWCCVSVVLCWVNNKVLSISLIPCMLYLIFMLYSVVFLSLVKSLEDHNETMKDSVGEEPVINKVHSNPQIY